jgi:hypothetical protein
MLLESFFSAQQEIKNGGDPFRELRFPTANTVAITTLSAIGETTTHQSGAIPKTNLKGGLSTGTFRNHIYLELYN